MSELKFKIGDKVRLTEEWKKHAVNFPDNVACAIFTVVNISKRDGALVFYCRFGSSGIEVPEDGIELCSQDPHIQMACDEGSKEDMFANLTQQMLETFKKKNADYGDSTTQTFKEFGLTSYATRLNDKLNRIKSFCRKGELEVKDESVVDSLMDMASYCLLAIIDVKNQDKD